MSNFKIIVNFILSFITSVLLAILVLLIIFKCTVFSPSYVKNLLSNNDYYQLLKNNIDEEIKDYNVSSKIPNDVFNNIYSLNDIECEVNNFIDNYYLGRVDAINEEGIKTKLTDNINSYLLEHNLRFTDSGDINSFIYDIIKIISNNINLYNLLNNYADTFKSIGDVINILIVIAFIILFINTLVLKKIKTTYGATIIMASSLILLFMRFIIFNEIEVTSIAIISNEFSKIIIEIYKSICNLTVIWAIVFLAISLIMLIIRRNKEEKRSVIYGRN